MVSKHVYPEGSESRTRLHPSRFFFFFGGKEGKKVSRAPLYVFPD